MATVELRPLESSDNVESQRLQSEQYQDLPVVHIDVTSLLEVSPDLVYLQLLFWIKLIWPIIFVGAG